MSSILIYLNTLIFIILSGLHIYWVFGGKLGIPSAIPSNPHTNNPIFKPGKIGTLAVAIGLLIFASIMQSNIFILNLSITKYLTYTVACIFLIRAVGEFNYIGLFKRTKNTAFARNDNRYFIPLCIYLSASTFYIAA